ncbi:MAG: MmgE/PrpD family protein [Pseudomonadota bacterium]|nr:MmgE/PrpD family protein [Pseudomonadota bacterium]
MALDQVRTSDETVLETLANWAADVSANWPDVAVDRAARAFEDTIACMIAGADDLSPVKTRKGIANWGTGTSTVVGQSAGAPAPWAAMANGTAAHALDYDDNVTIVLGHTSAVQVPALLALGELTGATGRQLIDAYIVGFEIQMALGRGVNWSHYNIGWHSTSTIIEIGTAGACARLLGLDRAGMAHAMSLATSMACGPKAQFGSMAKSFHAGLAAQHAVTSAQLAEAGLEGRMEVLEAPMGFLELFGGKFPPGWENALDGFGDTLAILEYGVIPKRHPCCASTHKCLDAVIDLRNEHGFSAGDVESVHTTVGSSNARNLSYDDPQNDREAKFSMQYCVALGLVQDHLRIADFAPEVVFRPEIRDLIPRITMEALPAEAEKTGMPPDHEVSVRLKDGRVLETTRAHPRGTIYDPLDADDRKAKYIDCVLGKLDDAAAEDLQGLLAAFETVEDLDTIMKFLRFDAG